MTKVLYEKNGRIGCISLNGPEVMSGIDGEMSVQLAVGWKQDVAERDHGTLDWMRDDPRARPSDS